MQFGGVVGSVAYQGYLSEFLPLMDLAEKLHIGKQSTFGLGKIEYSWDAES
jgi:CRISPR/Cas system endoribonuclease Cas6 (RAMP superfamily)